MAKDIYHNDVKEALIKDGWSITQDPYYLDIGDAAPLEIDLGAEKLISAERGTDKIAVEVKSFLNRSVTYDFHQAYGQFRIYRRGLMGVDPQRVLFLAIPNDSFQELKNRKFYMNLIADEGIKILVFNPLNKSIVQWLT